MRLRDRLLSPPNEQRREITPSPLALSLYIFPCRHLLPHYLSRLICQYIYYTDFSEDSDISEPVCYIYTYIVYRVYRASSVLYIGARQYSDMQAAREVMLSCSTCSCQNLFMLRFMCCLVYLLIYILSIIVWSWWWVDGSCVYLWQLTLAAVSSDDNGKVHNERLFFFFLQQMEFEWVLHEEVHSSLSQLRNILMVSQGFKKPRSGTDFARFCNTSFRMIKRLTQLIKLFLVAFRIAKNQE